MTYQNLNKSRQHGLIAGLVGFAVFALCIMAGISLAVNFNDTGSRMVCVAAFIGASLVLLDRITVWKYKKLNPLYTEEQYSKAMETATCEVGVFFVLIIYFVFKFG